MHDKIRPFTIEIPQSELDKLHQRLDRTRWPQEAPEPGWGRGVPVEYLKGLAEYWRAGYDWREQEARLNAFPQFITEIQGQPIHFLHVRSADPGALPLVITHGWPGSFVEFTQLIGPLTDPKAHGGAAGDAFHVVAPSLPGFGFSTPLTHAGWNNRQIAGAWAELMRRLGYDRYVAQGGDFGAGVSRNLGLVDPEHVAAIHVNGGLSWADANSLDVQELSELERARLQRLGEFMQSGSGYAWIQATRPQTVSYGLTDSPAGLLAWIVEKFKEWTDQSAELPEDAVDRDQMLTNVSLYWFTRCPGSAAQIYRENAASWAQAPEPSQVPSGVAMFTAADFGGIRRNDERTNNVVHWSEFDRGGHFAAMETPGLLVEDMKAFFRRFRTRAL